LQWAEKGLEHEELSKRVDLKIDEFFLHQEATIGSDFLSKDQMEVRNSLNVFPLAGHVMFLMV
jgi:hypothetical protein